MKSIINKIFFTVVASAMLLLTSCESEDNINITTPDPTFELDIPGISNVFLNYSLPDNPAFTITWNDGVTSATSYNIEMATEDTFATPVALGTTSEKSFSMTVTELNQAINNAGITEFNDIPVFMRVKAGEQVSNSVLFLVTTYPVNAPTLESGLADGDSFTLSLDMNDQNAFALVINDPILDANLGVTVDYFLEAAVVGTDFATVEELGTSTDSANINVTHAKLNAVAQALGIAPDTTGDIEIRLRSVITNGTGDTLERIGTPITVTVSTYLTVLDLSTTWGIVGSAANNWGATPDLPFFKTDVDGVLAAYVTLIDGQIKFRENNDWAVNYGDTGADGSIELNGDNIDVTAGSYKITLNFNDNTYAIEAFSLGIVGSAYNDWGATPDFMLEYDQYSDVFRGIVTLLDGDMKLRMNNDWAVNYGDTGADGSIELNGDNITVTAGIYIVTVDLNDNSYSLEQITNVWGLVGSAFNNWGATPDAQFTRDWSRPFDDVWILRDVELLDGEFKFRANNAWDINYGDTGGDGTLEVNGDNLTATAGTYTITLDFSDAANPTYTIQP
ncbi:SusE domain-containing protein [uncultured Tenacibaculum sp.]|uniref:SusE domain-containing protein n=1 Tax=uncultured Tenacibaculum sp. TaxID=174713 RepID=UPI002634C5EE|nr:SusE domain-containing protein [uncultured Tenacibaculum sp.]